VTGSRSWTTEQTIEYALYWVRTVHGRESIIVHGHCPRGADAIADRLAISMGFSVERHPAQWDLYGRRAGFIRNTYMVDAGAQACLAFIRDNSKGATMCAQLAAAAGIPVTEFRE